MRVVCWLHVNQESFHYSNRDSRRKKEEEAHSPSPPCHFDKGNRKQTGHQVLRFEGMGSLQMLPASRVCLLTQKKQQTFKPLQTCPLKNLFFPTTCQESGWAPQKIADLPLNKEKSHVEKGSVMFGLGQPESPGNMGTVKLPPPNVDPTLTWGNRFWRGHALLFLVATLCSFQLIVSGQVSHSHLQISTTFCTCPFFLRESF